MPRPSRTGQITKSPAGSRFFWPIPCLPPRIRLAKNHIVSGKALAAGRPRGNRRPAPCRSQAACLARKFCHTPKQILYVQVLDIPTKRQYLEKFGTGRYCVRFRSFSGKWLLVNQAEAYVIPVRETWLLICPTASMGLLPNGRAVRTARERAEAKQKTAALSLGEPLEARVSRRSARDVSQSFYEAGCGVLHLFAAGL